MTFNVRTSLTFDGLNSWVFRQSMVTDIIRDKTPDLILIQEANPMQISYLRSQIPGYRIATAGIGSQWFGYPIILFREDRFTVNTTERLWFSFSPNREESVSWGNEIPRCITAVTLYDKFQSRTFVVASTHLDHKSSDSRVMSIEMLTKWAHENKDSLVILGGDFNVPAESKDLDILRGTTAEYARNFDLLRDCVDETDRGIGTLHGFDGSKGPRVDLIFTSSEWVFTDSSIITYNRSGRYPSDHYPVVVTLKYPVLPLMAKR